MKIEVGKFYKTRNGEKVRIYCADAGGDYPIHGAYLDGDDWASATWTGRGFAWVHESDHSQNIVSEWIDRPEMDWSVLPRWAKWIASNTNGYWYWYTAKPVIDQSCFYFPCSICGDIPSDYAPKWSGDWKESLTEVPRKD